jgi:hypothetical protein
VRPYADTLLVYHSDSLTSPRRIPLSGNGSTTSVTEAGNVPATYELAQNYPNPFNPSTTIRFGLPMPSHVRLTIHDVLGREIARLEDGVRSEGYHQVLWSPQASSGVYFMRLEARGLANASVGLVEVRKMVLVK